MPAGDHGRAQRRAGEPRPGRRRGGGAVGSAQRWKCWELVDHTIGTGWWFGIMGIFMMMEINDKLSYMSQYD